MEQLEETPKILVVGIFVLCGFIGGYIGEKRRGEFGKGFVWGFIFGPVGILWLSRKKTKGEIWEDVKEKIQIDKLIIYFFLAILISDQLTKWLVVQHFEEANDPQEKLVVINGFFDLVHRTNTGAAFSLFTGKSGILAIISIFAAGALVWFRHHFDNGTRKAKIALGLLLGGIIGNMIDRLAHGAVVDFARVYIERNDGTISEWPAFNVADSAICVGVGLLFLLAWTERDEPDEEEAEPKEA